MEGSIYDDYGKTIDDIEIFKKNSAALKVVLKLFYKFSIFLFAAYKSKKIICIKNFERSEISESKN